jgi:hypothetical protein
MHNAQICGTCSQDILHSAAFKTAPCSCCAMRAHRTPCPDPLRASAVDAPAGKPCKWGWAASAKRETREQAAGSKGRGSRQEGQGPGEQARPSQAQGQQGLGQGRQQGERGQQQRIATSRQESRRWMQCWAIWGAGVAVMTARVMRQHDIGRGETLRCGAGHLMSQRDLAQRTRGWPSPAGLTSSASGNTPGSTRASLSVNTPADQDGVLHDQDA